MNKSIMMGRLVKDPDIRYSQTNNGELAVASFRLAVDRKYVREGDPKADFFRCTAFGRKAEFVANYLFQGIKVVVEGRMQNDNYTNRDGEKVYGVCLMVDDVDFAESKKVSEERQERERQNEDDNGKGETRNSSRRSERPVAADRERNPEDGRREGSARRSEREADYREDRDAERSSGRSSSSSRYSGGRNSSSRSSESSSSSRRSQERSRDLDDRFMDAPDEELDFD